jgi:glucose/arabinose dehydrogenase
MRLAAAFSLLSSCAPQTDALDRVAQGLTWRPSNPTCRAPPRPTSVSGVRLAPVFAGVTADRPVAMVEPSTRPGRFYLLEQVGRVLTFSSSGDASATVAIDLRDRVDASAQETGLLGIAFHPRDATQVFLSYTARRSGRLLSRVSRFRMRSGDVTIDPSSEQPLLEVEQPADNHNGGHIVFGPDGSLYFGLGDGGGAGDPFGHGQRTDTLLASLLRIDVDRGSPYSIPEGNPFARGGGRPEIFAWGFRNPWRFSFDRATAALWLGDVGQDALEEIDVVERGGNYGWSTLEGTRCVRPGCSAAGTRAPVFEYGRSDGLSITGGFVYRGRRIAALEGAYVFGDFARGTIWALERSSATGAFERRTLVEGTGLLISSFAEDLQGELYVLGYGARGSIHRIEPAGAPPRDVPARLSETGCFDPVDPRRPVEGLVPYEVNAALWSDGASKERWFAIPDGIRISVRADGTLDLPVGSVLVKQFSIAGRRIETRLMVRHEDGGWAGYTYAWREDQSDADLLRGGRTSRVGEQDWSFPSRGEC